MYFTACFVNLALILFLIEGGIVTCQEPTKLPVSTRYITTKETTLLQDRSRLFQATLCNEFYDHAVNATIILNNNPKWVNYLGVVDYYIVDSPLKGPDKALCTNAIPDGRYEPNCYVKNWNSSSDLYIRATAVQTDSLVFTLDVEINKKPTKHAHTVTKEAGRYHNYPSEVWKPYMVNEAPELLFEIVNIGTSQPLVSGEAALLNITFCKNAETTDNYEITSTVFGTDGKSSYTQYLCNKLPCFPGSHSVFKHEGKQLPNNVIKITTTSGEYQNFLVLIICWGGEYDAKKGENIGFFEYNAQIQRVG